MHNTLDNFLKGVFLKMVQSLAGDIPDLVDLLPALQVLRPQHRVVVQQRLCTNTVTDYQLLGQSSSPVMAWSVVCRTEW